MKSRAFRRQARDGDVHRQRRGIALSAPSGSGSGGRNSTAWRARYVSGRKLQFNGITDLIFGLDPLAEGELKGSRLRGCFRGWRHEYSGDPLIYETFPLPKAS